ncbi:MAG: hypothetical protein ACLFMO_01455 [Eubacteriales bacterium]
MKRILFFCLVIIIILSGCNAKDDSGDSSLDNEQEDTRDNKYNEDNDTQNNNNYTQINEDIKKLLPEREDFTWRYNGSIDYGHTMILNEIVQSEDSTTYSVNGEVDDLSGGESTADYSIQLYYRIEEGKLIQEKREETMLDSKFDDLVLIQAPLEEGNSWIQTVLDKEGNEVVLDCTITEVEKEKMKTYTIEYNDQNSDYYETRQIQEGYGTVYFTSLYETDFEMSYSLYREYTGYNDELALKEYLPLFQGEMYYFGLAEYGHLAELDSIEYNLDETIYKVKGSFQDGSGIPGDFTVNYKLDHNNGTIQEQVVENTRENNQEVNSIMHDPIILKAPIQVGNEWSQSVKINEESYTMNAVITKMDIQNGLVTTTVKYTVDGVRGYFRDQYIEERTFQHRNGMVGFAKLIEGDIGISGKDLEDSNKVQEAIDMHMFGYGLSQH